MCRALIFCALTVACGRSGPPDATPRHEAVPLTAAGPRASSPEDIGVAADVTAAADSRAAEDANAEARGEADAGSAPSPDATDPMPVVPIALRPTGPETRGLVRRIGTEDAAAGARAYPAFSADGTVVLAAGESRITFFDARDGRWLGALAVTPPLLPPADQEHEQVHFAEPRMRAALSADGTTFALVREDGPGVVAARTSGAILGALPPAVQAMFVGEDRILALAGEEIAALDRAGNALGRFAVGANASAITALGEATYVVFADGIRPFDATALAWTGSLLRAGGEKDRVCGVRGHRAVLDASDPQAWSPEPRVVDLRSGRERKLSFPEDGVPFECGRHDVFPAADGMSAIATSHFCPPVDCFTEITRLSPKRGELLDRVFGDAFAMALAEDDARLAISGPLGLSILPTDPRGKRTADAGMGPGRDRRESLSPDGRYLARLDGSALELFDLDVGRRVPLRPAVGSASMTWTRDSAHLLVLGWKYEKDEYSRLYFSWLDVAHMRLTAARGVHHALPGEDREEWEPNDLGLTENKEGGPPGSAVVTRDGRIGVALGDDHFVALTPGEPTYRVETGVEIAREDPREASLEGVVVDGRWKLEPARDDRSELRIVALAPELRKHGVVRAFEPHLGPYHGFLLRPDHRLVTWASGVVAVWDVEAFLAQP